MIKAIRQNKIIRDSGWMNDTVFVDERENSEYFGQKCLQQLNVFIGSLKKIVRLNMC